jgi:hypothetical protein
VCFCDSSIGLQHYLGSLHTVWSTPHWSDLLTASRQRLIGAKEGDGAGAHLLIKWTKIKLISALIERQLSRHSRWDTVDGTQ